MIYAIAMTNNKLSHQFSKSDNFAFYNEKYQIIAVHDNPALGITGCSAKLLIIQLLQEMHCDVVIVRKVGEKTLAKLLNAGLQVEQGNTRDDIKTLLESAKLHRRSLNTPEQGVLKKASDKNAGGRCCSHH